MSDSISIFHNPRCSKSRQTLALIEEKGLHPTIILYLENTPSAKELSSILKKLGKSPQEIIRKGEEIYKTLDVKNQDLSDRALVELMVKHPKLIERPIVIKGEHAVLGRPPENVLALL